MDFSVPSPLDYFAALVADDASLSLTEAAASLAQIEDPESDTQAVLAKIDELTAQLLRRIPADASALSRLHWLNHFFFQELGFAGNPNDYYAPGNSFIATVLRTRRGIPISLAVIYLELAAGIGLVARGVSFPGHFLVKLRLSQGEVLIDPFSGQSLSGERLQEMLQPYLVSQGLVGDLDVPLALFLQASPAREIVARMLRNLKEVYRSAADAAHGLAVSERLVILLPTDWAERRDRGVAHAALGHNEQALRDLSDYLAHAEGAPDAVAIGERIVALRGSGRTH